MIAVLRNWSSSARAFAQDVASRPVRLRPVVEGVLVAVLLVQGGRLIWTVVEPRPVASIGTPAARAPADLTVFQRFDAFFRTGGQSSMAEDTATGSSQMRLFGVRADGGGGGSAIIGLADGRQVSVGVGEEIEPGLTLHAVGADHVVLSRNGALSRLIFAETPMGAAPPPPPPPGDQVVAPPAPPPAPSPASATAAVDPAQLMSQASLRPRMRGLAVNGFTVNASGAAPALGAAGLQAGDVILAVNGIELNSAGRIADLRRNLATASSAEIRFERGGEVRSTTIRTAR
ncbi:type II secretion system protein N [Brevundimonas sp. FT23028]|uniref:type II secretion system protein N n=1 Tax=Brevundimonas sp. FT23028 TaxID=3393748 RepID=UPI003B589548